MSTIDPETYAIHLEQFEGKAFVERCCDAPQIETARGLGIETNHIVTVYCSTCGHDFMSIWPKGTLHPDGWPKAWSRPPKMTAAQRLGCTPGCFESNSRNGECCQIADARDRAMEHAE